MSSHIKLNWSALELTELPRVVRAPDDPLCDVDGFIALPCVTPARPRPTGWQRWFSGNVAGEA